MPSYAEAVKNGPPPRRSPVDEIKRYLQNYEALLEVSLKTLEIKIDSEIGEKVGRATAQYYGKMMEYFEDEGFTRDEAIQLLCVATQPSQAQ